MFFIQTCFSSVQLRSFLYLDARVRPSSLQHIVPLGLNLHHISYPTPSFQLRQSAIYRMYTEDFRSRVKIITKTQIFENQQPNFTTH